MKHSVKKIVSLFLILLILLSVMIPTVAQGAIEIVLYAPNVVANPGDTVDVDIVLQGKVGLWDDETIIVEYDSSVLTLTNVTDAGVFGAPSYKPEYTSPYTLAWDNTANTANGTIATLTFKVSDNAVRGQSYPIALSFNDNNNIPIRNGSVSILNGQSLTSISVYNKPTKTDYYVGDVLDTSGLQLKLSYDDGSVSYISSGFETSGYDSTTPGTKSITVTYGGKSTSFNVSVSCGWFNMSFDHNDVDPGDTVDMVISISKNPGIVSATLNVEFDSSVLTLISVKDAGLLGTHSHKPEYTSPYTLVWANDTATENYTVNGKIATLTFQVSEDAVRGQSYPISLSYDYDNYDIYDKDLNPVYFGITNREVRIRTLRSISVSKQPTKKSYRINEPLDTYGLELKVLYNNGSWSYITSGFATSGFDSTTPGTKTVTVTYEGLTTTFDVDVKAGKITLGNVKADPGETVDVRINLSNNPGIVAATLKVEFDSSVLTLTNVTDEGVLGAQSHKPEYTSPYTLAWANDTATENYTVNGTIATLTFKVSENAVRGQTYPITLSYDYDNYDIYNKDLTPVYFDVTDGSVKVGNLSSISVSKLPIKTTYYVGEALETTGLELELNYNDGYAAYITSGFTTSGFSSSKPGTKTVTVSYGGKTTTFDVVVKEPVIPRILAEDVTADPGDTVDVKISLSDNPGIVSATLNVSYDNSILTLTKVTDAGVLGANSHKPELIAPYTLAWANDTATSNYAVNGTIATLTFKVSNDAVRGQSYPISLSYNYDNFDIYDKDLNPIQFSVTNGCIMISEFTSNKLLGDVDDDEEVGIIDATYIQRFNAGFSIPISEADILLRGDVDGDGEAGVIDATLIQRYNAGFSTPYPIGEPI